MLDWTENADDVDDVDDVDDDDDTDHVVMLVRTSSVGIFPTHVPSVSSLVCTGRVIAGRRIVSVKILCCNFLLPLQHNNVSSSV